MSGKEAIIERIISDAETSAREAVEKANGQAEQIRGKAEKAVAEKMEAVKAKSSADAAEILRRRMSVANLDAKKGRLSVKQKLIESAFENARQAVINMDEKSYRALVGKLIKHYAVDGETVIIAENDQKRITRDFLDTFGKKLKLGKKFGDFDGGVILSKDDYEKNLTLDVLLFESRERVENRVASALFGE